ncbi:MAG TPA: hypothetical protein VER33_07855 [Polyangiaceae bacterium]|nr:hypothetical protein [Polyangiaceae bacterium]
MNLDQLILSEAKRFHEAVAHAHGGTAPFVLRHTGQTSTGGRWRIVFETRHASTNKTTGRAFEAVFEYDVMEPSSGGRSVDLNKDVLENEVASLRKQIDAEIAWAAGPTSARP